MDVRRRRWRPGRGVGAVMATLPAEGEAGRR